jgi:hypothetical protein
MGEHEEELFEALEGMARQYLSDFVDGCIMTHDFTAAGKQCLNVLESFGRVKTIDGIQYTWEDGSDLNF